MQTGGSSDARNIIVVSFDSYSLGNLVRREKLQDFFSNLEILALSSTSTVLAYLDFVRLCYAEKIGHILVISLLISDLMCHQRRTASSDVISNFCYSDSIVYIFMLLESAEQEEYIGTPSRAVLLSPLRLGSRFINRLKRYLYKTPLSNLSLLIQKFLMLAPS